MKMNGIKHLLCCALCWALTVPALAQSKVGIINLQKVFDGYYKTKQADATLKDRASEFDKQRKDLVEGHQKANEEYKKVLDSTTDQTVSIEERDKRKKSAEAKLREIQEIESQVTQFDRTARTTLNEQQRRMRDAILREIMDVVNTKAKAAGYSMVIDTAAQTVNNTLVVVYSNGENDIGEEVIKELNRSVPAEALKPAEAKPATAPTQRLSPAGAPLRKSK